MVPSGHTVNIRHNSPWPRFSCGGIARPVCQTGSHEDRWSLKPGPSLGLDALCDLTESSPHPPQPQFFSSSMLGGERGAVAWFFLSVLQQ